MSLSDRIKQEAAKNRCVVSTNESLKMQALFNRLFYLPKNIEEEVAFVRSVMTRGAEEQERVGMHASAILETESKFCYRAQILSLFYHQLQGEQVEAGLKRIFEEGDAIHQKWQRLFIRAGWATWKDLDFSRFEKQYDLSYTPDAIIRIPKSDSEEFSGEYVVEIKSVNTYQFQKMKTGNSRHSKGEIQCKFYEHLTDIDKGILLCEDKNTQEFMCFILDKDAQKVLPYIRRLEQIQYYKQRLKKHNKLVARPKDATDKDCKRCSECNMRNVCWNVGEKKRLNNV